MNASKRLSLGVVIACIALLGGAIIGGTAASAKKKKSKSVDLSKSVNLPIPDKATPTSLDGVLPSTIEVGKRFKGKVVGSDMTVTLQTLGSAAGAASQLRYRLQGPSGRTITLVASNQGGAGATGSPSIGPLTLSPNTNVQLCNAAAPPCLDPDQALNRPFTGTAQDNGLALFYGTKLRGNWTLRVYDTANLLTSALIKWSLHVTPASPIT